MALKTPFTFSRSGSIEALKPIACKGIKAHHATILEPGKMQELGADSPNARAKAEPGATEGILPRTRSRRNAAKQADSEKVQEEKRQTDMPFVSPSSSSDESDAPSEAIVPPLR